MPEFSAKTPSLPIISELLMMSPFLRMSLLQTSGICSSILLAFSFIDMPLVDIPDALPLSSNDRTFSDTPPQ